MLQEAGAAQFVGGDALHLHRYRRRIVVGGKDGDRLPAAHQVAHHLRPFGHKQSFALPVFLLFQLPYQLYLVLAYHALFFLSNGSLQRHAQQLLRLDGKLHRQFLNHLLGIAVHYQADSLLRGYAALVAVEQLVL